MDKVNEAIVVLAFSIIFALLLFCIVVALCRWIFRINKIVELLKEIAHADEKDFVFRHQSDSEHCASCEQKYPTSELIKIDSGQLICPVCHKIFENKKSLS